MQQKKKKFTLEDYAGNSKGCSYIKGCSKFTETLKCVCDNDDGDGMKCFKCGSYTHKCIQKQKNRGNKFECASCISKALDPIFSVRKVLIQSYFETKSIFQFYNQINFQFSANIDELCHPLQVRGIKAGSTNLSWPMQGAFYLNDQRQPFYELRPLQVNSSRKNRKEEYIIIPRQRLKQGKNYIRFRIVVVKRSFAEKYQCEDKGVYYMSINSINIISKDTLIKETFYKRRLEPKESLSLLSESSGGLQITKEKLILTCPLTMNKIKIPVRGRYCKHFGCACLETVAKFHTQSRQWSCPFCDSRMNQPFIDILVYEILKDRNQANTVYIQKDGSYQWIQPVQLIGIDDDDESSPHRQVNHKGKEISLLERQDSQVEIICPTIQHQNIEIQSASEQIVEVRQPRQIIQVPDQPIRIQKSTKPIQVIHSAQPIQILQPDQRQQPMQIMQPASILQARQARQRLQPEQPAQVTQITNILAESAAQEEKREISRYLTDKIKLTMMKMSIQRMQKQGLNLFGEIPAEKQGFKSSFNLEIAAPRNQNKKIRIEQARRTRSKPILTDIPELRSREISKELFKKQNMHVQLPKQKAMARFLKQHSELKSLFIDSVF